MLPADDTALTPEAAAAVLRWYADSGIDTAEGAEPAIYADWPEVGFRAAPPAPPPHLSMSPTAEPPRQTVVHAEDGPMPTDQAIALAEAEASAAQTLDALITAISSFEGCALKGGARSTVTHGGLLGAPVLVLGEAPGREEDRMGQPFVSRAGDLLDKMLGAIGVSRTEQDGLVGACATNTIYWRPPGNRVPTKSEIAICLPFVRRFIALSAPRIILAVGNVSTQALFPDAPGITRARGKWRTIDIEGGKSIPVLPLFHPAFLLRQPAQKRLAWQDLRAAKEKIHQD